MSFDDYTKINLTNDQIVSDRYLSPEYLEILREKYSSEGYVKLPKLIKRNVFNSLKNEVQSLYAKKVRRDFIMPGYKTPRNLSVIGGSFLLKNSSFLVSFYNNPLLKCFISKLVQKEISLVTHPEEYMVINFLERPADNHGWHLDDPAYALVIVIQAPEKKNGGYLEFIPNWSDFCEEQGITSEDDVGKTLQFIEKTNFIYKRHHVTTDCYFLNTRTHLHRVSSIKNSCIARIILNLAFNDQESFVYGKTADYLYGN